MNESQSPSLNTSPVDLPLPASLHVRCRLDPDGPADRKKIALGTKPISLRTFRCGGQPYLHLSRLGLRVSTWVACFQAASPGSELPTYHIYAALLHPAPLFA